MRLSWMALQSNGLGCSNIHNHFGADSDYLGNRLGLSEKAPISPRNRSGQNPSNGGAADLQAAGDLGFADAGTMQLSRLVRLEPGCYGSAQCLTVLSGVGQAGAHPFPQNFSFELREYCQ